MVEWVPIVLFLVVGAVFALGLFLRFRAKQELYRTLRELIANGDQSGLGIEQLIASLNPPDADLRRGLISTAIGLAFIGLAFTIGEPDATGPLIGVGVFPVAVGLVYLVMWAHQNRRARAHTPE